MLLQKDFKLLNYREIYQNLPYAMILCDCNTGILDMNPKALSMFQLLPEKAKELRFQDLLKPGKDSHTHLFYELMQGETGQQLQQDFQYQIIDQNCFWGKTTVIRLLDQEPVCFMILVDDVDLLRRASEKQKNYSRHLEGQNKALEELTYVISHDLREPIRTIRSFAQIIVKKHLIDSASKEAMIDMQYIIDAAGRMDHLLMSMLQYSRLNAGHYTLELVETKDVIQDILSDLGSAIRESGASIQFGTLPCVATNKVLFGQVIQNIVHNSLKYRQADRPLQITIQAIRREFEYLFSIEDNGQGFDPKDKDRVFRIFQRLHAGDSKYEGTGIGLSLCKRIIEKQGGMIWADSQKGKGTTIFFTIPVIPD